MFSRFCFLQRNLLTLCLKEPSLNFLEGSTLQQIRKVGPDTIFTWRCLQIKGCFFRIGNRRKLKYSQSHSFRHNILDCRCTEAYLYHFVFMTVRCNKLQKLFSGTSCTIDWLFDKVRVHINIQQCNILLDLLMITYFFEGKSIRVKSIFLLV